MNPYIVAVLAIIAAPPLFIGGLAWAGEEHWINREHRTNPVTKQWCCNDQDCKPIPALDVQITTAGFRLKSTGEEIPDAEAQQSSDAEFWVCRLPSSDYPPAAAGVRGKIRCFFFPPGGA